MISRVHPLRLISIILLVTCTFPLQLLAQPPAVEETPANLDWWRDARFGMFIHWGLYAIPAGEWNGETNHAEWIRTTAEIPLETYDQFVGQFNPVRFDANAWVNAAKNAGMKYIVITSKHHDGFALFDSDVSEYDIMSTPFQRDILNELAEACKRENIKLGFYHSIMDWHHPDYLPRRGWESDRSTDGARYDRYVLYMKTQLRELVTKYPSIEILWFDGEWEDTWTHEMGLDLYDYVKDLKPGILINNRVDKGRAGMAGLTIEGDYAGDFGTPEQEVPATGLPGVDWESCVTMNDHWGYNKNDDNWKSATELIRMLIDIASKGGNFLLNIGPKADGTFPPESLERLEAMGNWLDIYGESVYGSSAGPFSALPWGRATAKAPDPSGPNPHYRLFLHVFDWPEDGKLHLPGLASTPLSAMVHGQESTPIRWSRTNGEWVFDVSGITPDPAATVISVEFSAPPETYDAPEIVTSSEIFTDSIMVEIESVSRAEIRYSLDGSRPTSASDLYQNPVRISESSTVTAGFFKDGVLVSPLARRTLTRVQPRPGQNVTNLVPGLAWSCYTGDWNTLPDFDEMAPISGGTAAAISPTLCDQSEYFAMEFSGYLDIARSGVYKLTLTSDDGSLLIIGDQVVIDNDGLHGSAAKTATIALGVGKHPIEIRFFQKTGGRSLELMIDGMTDTGEIFPKSGYYHPSDGR